VKILRHEKTSVEKEGRQSEKIIDPENLDFETGESLWSNVSGRRRRRSARRSGSKERDRKIHKGSHKIVSSIFLFFDFPATFLCYHCASIDPQNGFSIL